MNKFQKLRKMINGDKIVKVIGAHDGLSAKIGEEAGFDAVWASGLCISAVNRVPDASILTMTDYLNAAIVMDESCNLPIIADCDSGFGNVHNAIRMVKKYEAAGIAGVCIEDKVYPKMNSFVNNNQKLIPIDDFCVKIKAIKENQLNPEFVLIARTESLIAKLGQDEAYKRAKAYSKHGADAILIHSKSPNSQEVEEFINRWDEETPIVVVPTMYPDKTYEEFERIGAKVVIYANHGLRASMKAITQTYNSIISNKSTLHLENKICTVKDVLEIQEVPEMIDLEKRLYSEVRGGDEK